MPFSPGGDMHPLPKNTPLMNLILVLYLLSMVLPVFPVDWDHKEAALGSLGVVVLFTTFLLLCVAVPMLLTGSIIAAVYGEPVSGSEVVLCILQMGGVAVLANSVFYFGVNYLGHKYYGRAGLAGVLALFLGLTVWPFYGLTLFLGYYVWLSGMAALAVGGFWGCWFPPALSAVQPGRHHVIADHEDGDIHDNVADPGAVE